MTVKEKAEQLYNHFSLYQPLCADRTFRHNSSKQCALIAVDELINATQCASDLGQLGENANDETKEYWMKVKEEITKL